MTADELATIVYTSGTTGRPKGVELTHRNLLAEIRADIEAFPQLMEQGNSLLCFLPLAHVLARAIAVTALTARVTLGHTPDVKNLVADLGTFRPTFVVAVPRVFEKVYNSAKQKAHGDGKGKIFDAAEAVAVAYSQAQDKGGAGVGAEGSSTWCSTSSSTASCARPSAAAASRRCPAARRSASGWRTSSAASASRCSRATA